MPLRITFFVFVKPVRNSLYSICSIHEEIRLPPVIDCPDEIPDEHNVVGSNGAS